MILWEIWRFLCYRTSRKEDWKRERWENFFSRVKEVGVGDGVVGLILPCPHIGPAIYVLRIKIELEHPVAAWG